MIYRDKRGWIYRVMPGLGGDTFKARYRKPDAVSWKGVAGLLWRPTRPLAQEDLDQMARERKWEALP